MKIVWNNKLCQVAKGNGVRLNNMRNGEKKIKYPRKRIETDNVK